MTNNILPPAKIGFVGLGNMGYPMALCLVKAGYRLTVADLNTQVVEKFCQATGSKTAENLRSLGADSDVVITMLPEGNAVRKVLMGDEGVVSGLQPGAIIVDMSSCSPVGTRQLAAELEAMDFPLLDAPVSGGVYKAAEGALAIMVGGEKNAVESCLPMLQVMGKPFKTGGPASGHAMKAMNNYLSEAVILGSKFGLDPEVMVNILNASTGRSNSTEHKFPAFILPRTFNSGFFIGLMAKDLRLARELAESEGTSADLLKLVSGMWDKAEADLGFKADNTEVYKYLESQSAE